MARHLYGTTEGGGPGGYGTIYKMNTDGSQFSVLHSFSSVAQGCPFGGLILVGSQLYGTASG